MKKLINDPNTVLADALVGVAAAHPELKVDHANRIIYRGTPKAKGKPKGNGKKPGNRGNGNG